MLHRTMFVPLLNSVCLLGLLLATTAGLADASVADEKTQLQATTAAGQVIINRAGGRANVVVREQVDREDAVERLLVLSPAGPIIVETTMMMNGRPFRVAREEAIDEMMAAADKDGDGEPTWVEAIESPLFSFGNGVNTNGQQRANYIKTLDLNKDGNVDRSEVRSLIARYSQGPAFFLTTSGNSLGGGRVIVNGYYAQNAGPTDLVPLLDTDGDDQLSEDEINATPARLKSRDGDDNDLLTAGELASTTSTGQSSSGAVRVNGRQQTLPITYLLGPTMDPGLLFQTLQARYANDDKVVDLASFRAMSDVFEKLDDNGNGKIEASEVPRINDVPAHVKLNVRLGEDDQKGLKITSVADGLEKLGTSNSGIVVRLPGFELKVSANLAPAAAYNYSTVGEQYLRQYDKNGNKYLEKDELPANLARQFASWDGDADGQVYAKEIVASFERRQMPIKTQLRGTATNDGNSLFQTLDQSGDGRLSLREMRNASDHLKSLDKNDDGTLAGSEIPVTISLRFSQGNSGGGFGRVSAFRANAGRRPITEPPNPESAPEWFRRMDRNGDGDVTLKEFLGTKEQFKAFDKNADGLLEPKEAKAKR